jgi:hypothetical protein
MVLTNRKFIQVVPQMTPMRCGVSDTALLLAGELDVAFGIKSAIVVVNSNERCEVQLPTVYSSPSALLEDCLTLSNGQPGHLLVHLSGYGYSADGAPILLAHALKDVKTDGRFRIAVFFHELFAGGMPWTSAFWNARRQKRALRAIAEKCDLLATSTHVYQDWLNKKTIRPSAVPIVCLPVFSLVGEAQRRVPFSARDPVMAVFGLAGTRQRAYRELPRQSHTLNLLGVQEILDIGPGCVVPNEVNGIPVKRLGMLSSAVIGRQFLRTAFGYLAYPPNCLGKSGVFAGYCAHGVIPVISQGFCGEMDGLKDGVQVLSPGMVKTIEPAGLENCSLAAWRWYSGHSLNDHASIYYRWLEGADPE